MTALAPTRRRTVLALVSALLLAPLALVLAAAPATASDPVTLRFHCSFPLLGSQPLAVRIGTSLPASVEAGKQTAPVQVDAVASIAAETTTGLVTVGAKSIEGTALAGARLVTPDGALDLAVPTTLEKTAVPASGGFDTIAKATIAPLTFPKAGTAQVTVDRLTLTITPRDVQGNTTGLDTFDSDCVLDPGQSNVVATVQVTGTGGGTGGGETASYGYTLMGASRLKASGANVPLSGSVAAVVTLATGAFSADLRLNPTTTSFSAYGFLPVQARVEFVPSGKTTGTLTPSGLTSASKVTVKVPSATAFGFPIGGGTTCQTTSPATIPLASTGAFNPLAGGPLTGTYTLPAFEGCGWATPLFSQLVSGSGNTVQVALKPAA